MRSSSETENSKGVVDSIGDECDADKLQSASRVPKIKIVGWHANGKPQKEKQNLEKKFLGD